MGQDDARPGGLGILLVHGMGSAEPGDTLRNIGEPLLDTLRRAPARAAGVRVGQPTRVELDGDEDRPAHVTFEVGPARGPGSTTTWWMAECHWGDSFRPPPIRDVVTWIVLVLPWTVISYFQSKWRELRRDGRTSGKRDAFLAILALFGALVLAPLMAALLVVVLVLAVPLSRIPVKVLHAPAKALIRVLSASLGDVYVLASRSFDRYAVDQRLQRDLDFLLERCSRVAIVAHSAGSYLAHCLLNRPEPGAAPAPDRVPLLVTYGQAVWRVHAVQNLGKGRGANRKWAVGASTAALFLGAAAVGLPLADVQWPWPVVPVVSVLCAAAALTLCGVAFWLVHRASAAAESSTGLGLANPPRWRDYVASTDPVPNGLVPPGLVTEEDREPRSYEGVRIHNGRSVVSDHNSYDSNLDVFFNGVARDLLWSAGHPARRDERVRDALDARWAWRRTRTRWLSTARVTYLACAGWLLAVSGWSDGPMALDVSTAMRFGTWLVDKLPASWTRSLFGIAQSTGSSESMTDTSLRAKLVGLAVLTLLLVLLYSAIRSSWGAWDHRSARQALGRESGGSPTERIRKIGPTKMAFLVGWLVSLVLLIGLSCWYHFDVPPGVSTAVWEGRRMRDQYFVPSVLLLAGCCLVAAAYTLSPARSEQDRKDNAVWDPGRVNDAQPPPSLVPGEPGPEGWAARLTLPDAWRQQLTDVESRLTGVVEDGDRVCLESRWEGTPTAPVRTTSGPHPPVLGGCRLVLRVAQVLEVRDGELVTVAHYVDGVLHPAPAAPEGNGAAPPGSGRWTALAGRTLGR